jgi:hypothetical protein
MVDLALKNLPAGEVSVSLKITGKLFVIILLKWVLGEPWKYKIHMFADNHVGILVKPGSLPRGYFSFFCIP